MLIKRGWSLTVGAQDALHRRHVRRATTSCSPRFLDNNVLIVELMSFAFFSKGVAAGAGTWAVVTDTAPKEAVGLAGARAIAECW